jgi:hypothetical protein
MILKGETPPPTPPATVDRQTFDRNSRVAHPLWPVALDRNPSAKGGKVDLGRRTSARRTSPVFRPPVLLGVVESEVCTHRYFVLGSLSQVARADWVADEVMERVTSVADWARRERANMAGERAGQGTVLGEGFR